MTLKMLYYEYSLLVLGTYNKNMINVIYFSIILIYNLMFIDNILKQVFVILYTSIKIIVRFEVRLIRSIHIYIAINKNINIK